jgi:hypothetical protein
MIQSRENKELFDKYSIVYGDLYDRVGRHNFLKESILCNPITCELTKGETENGMTQRLRDTQKDTLRKARALNIQHDQSSTSYDPITGEQRVFR